MKNKLICRLSAMLIAVLCVCLLCVPAFASAPVEGDLVEVLPLVRLSPNDDGWFNVQTLIPIIAGGSYILDWNGVKYSCTAVDMSSLISGAIGLGDLSQVGIPGNGEPFLMQGLFDGNSTVLTIIPLDGSSQLTLSIYEVVSPSKQIFYNITTYADALRIQLSATSVIEVLAYIAGAAVLGVFLWWGVRKAVKGIKSAYLRGKLRF